MPEYYSAASLRWDSLFNVVILEKGQDIKGERNVKMFTIGRAVCCRLFPNPTKAVIWGIKVLDVNCSLKSLYTFTILARAQTLNGHCNITKIFLQKKKCIILFS